MKGYVEASKFPITEVAGGKISRVVLGQHPYDGVQKQFDEFVFLRTADWVRKDRATQC